MKYTDHYSSDQLPPFNKKFTVLDDPREIIFDFAKSRVVDMSAIEALIK
jgi:SulP family sulfate permease